MIIRTVTPGGKLGKPKVIELEDRPVYGSVNPVTHESITVTLRSVDETIWIMITKAEYDMLHKWFVEK